MKTFGIISILLALLITACAKPHDYYTNPNKGGYLQQATLGICEKCNTAFKVSTYQTDHYEKITCAKCGHKQHMNQTRQRYVIYKAERDRLQAIQNQQAIANIVSGVLVGVAAGYAEAASHKNTSSTYQSSYSTYNPTLSYYSSHSESGCSTSTECGIGKKCVKPSWESNGVCMNTVDEKGNRTYELPGLVDTKGNCKSNSECPFGFTCDFRSSECIKR